MVSPLELHEALLHALFQGIDPLHQLPRRSGDGDALPSAILVVTLAKRVQGTVFVAGTGPVLPSSRTDLLARPFIAVALVRDAAEALFALQRGKKKVKIDATVYDAPLALLDAHISLALTVLTKVGITVRTYK